MKQCAVLFVDPEGRAGDHPAALRSAGFAVRELVDWPEDDPSLREYQVVVVYVPRAALAPMLAARLRAKRHFDPRVLIGVVDPAATPAERRAAQESGFDGLVATDASSRVLMARILRSLRARPELRCLLPPLGSGRRPSPGGTGRVRDIRKAVSLTALRPSHTVNLMRRVPR